MKPEELRRYALEKNVYYQTMSFRADACVGAAKIIKAEDILDDLIIRMDVHLASDKILFDAAYNSATARIKDYCFTEYVHRNDYDDLLRKINGTGEP